MQQPLIKSPLNYTGGKYKLLNQIIPLFPSDIDIFVDLFVGGLNVGININANKIIANDITKEIIELYKYLKLNDPDKVLQNIENIIDQYGLSNTSKHGYGYYNCDSYSGVAKYNKESYLKLRNNYNNKKNPLLFYTTLIYAFNNQIRFNSRGDFNMPVNKRDFNSNMKRKLKNFIEALHKKNIDFLSKSYEDVEINSNSFVYIDPPYLATIASYNENGGWDEKKEVKLLKYLDKLNSRNIRFALSNVFENKGKSNIILEEWSKNYNINRLKYNYSNCNYHSKIKDKDSTTEVLITNY